MWPRLGSLVPGPMAPITNRSPAVAGAGLDRLAGEARGALVDLERPRLEAELGQGRRAAEAVGLDRVGTGSEVALVDPRIRSGG